MIDRRRVSVQWFSGTILTGLCGAALIGGAVFASLDGEMTFAKVPERVEGALRGAFGANDRTATLHKSDRLPPPGESSAARNVVRVSTVTRVGNRDVMRVRPFVRISGNLSMTTSDLSRQDPALQRPAHADRRRHHRAGGLRRSQQSRRRRTRCRGRPSSPRISAPILPKAKLATVVPLDEITDAGARRLQLARPRTGGVQLCRAGQCHRRRQRRAAAASNWPMPPKATCVRPLCRFRNPGGAGKRHPAAEDQGPDHRRQPDRRTRPCRQEGRQRHRDPARPGRDARRSQGDRRDARRPRPRRRAEGRRETAHPDGAGSRPRRSGCSPTA